LACVVVDDQLAHLPTPGGTGAGNGNAEGVQQISPGGLDGVRRKVVEGDLCCVLGNDL